MIGPTKQLVRRLHERYGAWTDPDSKAGRIVFAIAILALMLSACFIRLSALNPKSLWYDDLAWAALTRADNLRAMLRAPTHAPPGFLILLRTFHGLFADPEWSVQLPPFICGIAAIPVMALAARRLTKSQGLGILAASLTALNPLLAHYTVYVKQYSLDFLVSALLLLIAATLLDGREIRASRVVQLTLFSGFVLLFSVGSVFVSAPIVGMVALRALWARKRGTLVILVSAVVFAVILTGAFFMFRTRTVGLTTQAIQQAFFGRSFAIWNIWTFLSTQGRRVVEISLPSWHETDAWQPDSVSWTLPFVGLGIVWLFARRTSRAFAWTVVGFAATFTIATYAQLYPLTNDRRAIFTFPVFICLGVMGFHCVTAWLPRRETLRLVAGVGVTAFALYAPIRVQYWAVDDARLIQRMLPTPPADGVILSPAATYLAGYYGPWPIAVAAGDTSLFEAVGIVRNRTAVDVTQEFVERFLGRANTGSVWYVAYRTSDEMEGEVLKALSDRGYRVERIEQTTRGTLYLGVQH